MIGIIFAMEEEQAEFDKLFREKFQVHKAGICFNRASLNNEELVYCVSGIGKVNAAMATQILIMDFYVDSIINVGLAGSLTPSLNRGDMVVASKLYQHDYDLTAFGYSRGEIPNCKEIIVSEELSKHFVDILNGYGETINWLSGAIVSGDQFISSTEQKEEILSYFSDACCCEMEGAAVGQVAQLNSVPCAILRCISDSGDENAAETFDTFLEDSVKVFTRILSDYITSFS